MTPPEWQPPTFDGDCTLCLVRIRHDHPDGLRPIWPCRFCHDGLHAKCNAEQFCSCDCGLRPPSDSQGDP